MSKKIKTSKQIERHVKGIANHRRIDILFLVDKDKGITLDQISERLNINVKTASGHTARLVQSGLVNKKYVGNRVAHSLSPYGRIFLRFIKGFSYSREYENAFIGGEI